MTFTENLHFSNRIFSEYLVAAFVPIVAVFKLKRMIMKNEEMNVLIEESQNCLLLVLKNLDELSKVKTVREKNYSVLFTLNEIQSRINNLSEELELLALELE